MSKDTIVNAIKDLINGPEDALRDNFEIIKSSLQEAQKPKKSIKLSRTKVKRVTPVENKQTTYVYDIGMKNESHPWFFANNMLVHNSAYFSAYPVFKKDIEAGQIQWDKDTIIQYYDAVCEEVSASFPAFMNQAFHCTYDLGKIIAAGREIVGEAGIFIVKKRYAILVFDDEGKRMDVDGKPGKIKAMGLDLKRSDTPPYMQEFLNEILLMTLTGMSEQEVLDRIMEFREDFRAMPDWEKGTPKRVNNLTNHTAKWKKTGKCGVGHALAAINWNRLREMNADKYSMEIVDGQKTIVCKLKQNPMGMTSVGYPTDESRIPEWFKELPFDTDAMEHAIITKKIENLLGVLNWDLASAESKNTFNDLFDFG